MRRRVSLLTRETICVAFCVAIFGASPASAATLDGGTFDSGSCAVTCSGSFGGSPQIGPINDLYAFVVNGSDPLRASGSVTNTFTTEGSQIDNFTISLFVNGGTIDSPATTGLALATFTAPFTPNATSGNQFAGLPVTQLSSGDYVLQVVGQVIGADPATYGGSFAFSAIPILAAPLPASLLLFAAGLGVFGVAGRRRYRRRAELPAG
jgi:hypothetical protein